MSHLEKRIKIGKSFGEASKSYDVSARLQRFSGKHLMPWLPIRHNLTVLDLGSGTGFFTDIFATKYQQVIGVDISKNMLRYAQSKRNQAIHWLEADMANLPLQSNSVDFVYCNLALQWCEPLEQGISEILRVLKPGGLFAFCTLVDGTLAELKTAWSVVDEDQHVIDFKTVTEINQYFDDHHASLLEQHQKTVVLGYADVIHLANELKGLGANHVPNKQQKGLSGKGKWQVMSDAYQQYKVSDGALPASYQLFFGLAVKLNV